MKKMFWNNFGLKRENKMIFQKNLETILKYSYFLLQVLILFTTNTVQFMHFNKTDISFN